MDIIAKCIHQAWIVGLISLAVGYGWIIKHKEKPNVTRQTVINDIFIDNYHHDRRCGIHIANTCDCGWGND